MYKKVYVEITNICNLKCDFCPHNHRENKMLSVEEFTHILNKLESHTNYLYFHVLGEPLLHPKINEFIELASKKFFINITTNGYKIEKIKENKKIRQLNISLQSYDESQNITIEEYLKTIFKTVEELKKTTFISYRIWVKNKYTEEIVHRLSSYYKKDISLKGTQNITLDKNVFLSIQEEFTWPKIDFTKEKSIGTCYALKDHIAILVDGTVVPCCLDSLGTINLGNIFSESLEEIIHSQRYQEMIQGFKENKRVEPLCQNCHFM